MKSSLFWRRKFNFLKTIYPGVRLKNHLVKYIKDIVGKIYPYMIICILCFHTMIITSARFGGYALSTVVISLNFLGKIGGKK